MDLKSEWIDIPFCRSQLEELMSYSRDRNASVLAPGNLSGEAAGREDSGQSELRWFQVLLSVICVLGISGNLLNLIILTRKRFCAPMGKLEQCANVGMIGLALSDLLFCLTVLPHSFMRRFDVNNGTREETNLFVLYYRVYGISLINVFIMSSTWLIVALAVERYTVLYYPLQAKVALSRRRSISVIFAIFALCGVCTLPYFLRKEVRLCRSIEASLMRYEIHETATAWTTALGVYIRHVWPAIAIFLPQTILFVCNVRLVQGLRSVQNIRRLKCPGQHIRDVNRRITLTLVIIVAMAIILVTPAEILKAVNPYVLWGDKGFVLASVANLLQTLNFAFNFVLYCVIDRHFRLICRGLFLTRRCARGGSRLGQRDIGMLMVYRHGTGTSSMV